MMFCGLIDIRLLQGDLKSLDELDMLLLVGIHLSDINSYINDAIVSRDLHDLVYINGTAINFAMNGLPKMA